MFTSSASATVAENSTGAIYTAVANDPDGGTIVYALAGGADRAQFNIDAQGRLSFAAPPDFEAPRDVDRNNVYQVEIDASDLSQHTTMSVSITVSDVVEATGFQVAVMGRPYSGADRMTFYNNGAIRKDVGRFGCFDFRNAQPYQSLREIYDLCRDRDKSGSGFVTDTRYSTPDPRGFSGTGEWGLLGWDYTTSYPASLNPGRLPAIALYTAANGDILVRWFYDGLYSRSWEGIFDPVRYYIPGGTMWRIPNSATVNLAGWIGVGPDGYLYIALGDAGDPTKAQDPASPFGKILRLDTTRDEFPSDNDRNFATPPGGIIVASGLRNPFRASFDVDGNLIIGDRGDASREEINVLRRGETGVNFGWPYFEGTLQRQAGGPAGMRAPALELEHGSGALNANKIVGGYVYTGAAAALRDQYIFGDASGKLWMIPRTRLLAGGLTGADLAGTGNLLTAPGRPLTSLYSFGPYKSSNGGNDVIAIDDTGFYYWIRD